MSGVAAQVLPGPSALPKFREERLLEEAKKLCPSVSGLRANYVHYLTPETRGEDLSKAISLLSYGLKAREVAADEAFFCLVLPREGTVSSWSSKATDVFHTCGLTGVQRVERGVRWEVRGKADERILPLLHDRMTMRASFVEDDHPFSEPESSSLSKLSISQAMAWMRCIAPTSPSGSHFPMRRFATCMACSSERAGTPRMRSS